MLKRNATSNDKAAKKQSSRAKESERKVTATEEVAEMEEVEDSYNDGYEVSNRQASSASAPSRRGSIVARADVCAPLGSCWVAGTMSTRKRAVRMKFGRSKTELHWSDGATNCRTLRSEFLKSVLQLSCATTKFFW